MSREFPFLEGPRLILRGLTEADADGPYPAWLNDAETCRGNAHHVRPFDEEEAREYIRAVRKDASQLVLAITVRDHGTHIGNIALQAIHPLFRRAELSILLGDPRTHGKGYGLEASRLLCRHGFEALNLHRIQCGTYADNAGMIGLAKSLGMREEGRRRQAAWKDGRHVDVVEFGMLREEFCPG
jgi:RimJ/RimL family protein N-acetyltransferase